MIKGNILKEYRKKYSLTQKELAKKLGYSLATIKFYETKQEKVSERMMLALENLSKTLAKEWTVINSKNEIANIEEKMEEINKREEVLKLKEKKLKKEELKLKKEKLLLALEENKSDYLKIKGVLIQLKSVIGELDIKIRFSKEIKFITKKEIINTIETDIKELEKIKNRLNQEPEDIIYDIK